MGIDIWQGVLNTNDVPALIKQYGPKHQNYKECHKRCPLFKRNSCYCFSPSKQKLCWEKLHVMYPDNFKEAVVEHAAQIAAMTAALEDPSPKDSLASVLSAPIAK